jgi:enoyl-CoA hydratase
LLTTTIHLGNRIYKLASGTTSGYGRYVESLGEPRVGADELSAAAEAEARRLATIPGNQLALDKMLINQAYENMDLRTTQMLGTFFDGMTRHTEEALQWGEQIAERGLREVVADRDRPWQDYGQRP